MVIALMAAGWWWIYLRTGSSHALHMRLWRVLTGTREITHPEIRAYIEEQDSLMAFRISSGMRVKSAAHAHRAIAFVSERGLSPDLIRQAGNYFEANELRMASLPSAWRKAWHFLSAMALVLLFAFAAFGSLEQRVLVSLKETGTWLWLADGEAQAARPTLLGDRPVLSFEKCPGPGARGWWSARDVAILCSIKTDPALGPYLEKTLKTQRLVFLVVAVFVFLLALSQWMELERAKAAHRLSEQLGAGEACPQTPAVPDHGVGSPARASTAPIA